MGFFAPRVARRLHTASSLYKRVIATQKSYDYDTILKNHQNKKMEQTYYLFQYEIEANHMSYEKKPSYFPLYLFFK